jgi:hypothetical protein
LFHEDQALAVGLIVEVRLESVEEQGRRPHPGVLPQDIIPPDPNLVSVHVN